MKRRKFPGVLWLLPLFGGVFGGTVAGLIASLKYGASWWELALAGFIMTCLFLLAYFFAIFVAISTV